MENSSHYRLSKVHKISDLVLLVLVMINHSADCDVWLCWSWVLVMAKSSGSVVWWSVPLFDENCCVVFYLSALLMVFEVVLYSSLSVPMCMALKGQKVPLSVPVAVLNNAINNGNIF